MIATTAVDGIRDTTDKSPPMNGATDTSADRSPELISTPYKLYNNNTSPGNSNCPEQIISHNRTVSTVEVSAIFAIPPGDSSIGSPALDKQSPPTKLGIVLSTEASNSFLPEVDTSVKQSVLDESGASLEHVLMTLKPQNNDM